MSTSASTTPQQYLQAQGRWHPLEIAFWLATLTPYFLFPDYLALASQIAVAALFAMSLDLLLGYAGVVGAVIAQTTQTVARESIGFQRSADVLVMLVLGGAGRLYGGLIGSIIFMIARDQFSGIAPQYWYFWIGVLLIGVVMLLPNGILGGLSALWARWRRPCARSPYRPAPCRAASVRWRWRATSRSTCRSARATR